MRLYLLNIYKFSYNQFKKIDILNDFLQNVIESPEYRNSFKADVLRILQYISDLDYIASLFLLNEIYYNVSKLEKETQSKHFGMIDYIELLTNECKPNENYKNMKDV